MLNNNYIFYEYSEERIDSVSFLVMIKISGHDKLYHSMQCDWFVGWSVRWTTQIKTEIRIQMYSWYDFQVYRLKKIIIISNMKRKRFVINECVHVSQFSHFLQFSFIPIATLYTHWIFNLSFQCSAIYSILFKSDSACESLLSFVTLMH